MNLDLEHKIFCGIVEDISDKERKGRIKVRVQGVFDNIPTNDIPWSCPFKSISGKSFELPSVGKLVNIVFPNNDLYSPEYIFSENYNINLQNKLNDYSQGEYENFIALLFDHKSQVFSDDKSLTMDYKYNKITIDNSSINLELKDNNQKINIGTKKATQQAMLGNHWLDWFDTFVRAWQNDTGMMGNGIIIVPPLPILKPEISYKVMAEYWTKRETFISDHVYIADDKKIKKLQ